MGIGEKLTSTLPDVLRAVLRVVITSVFVCACSNNLSTFQGIEVSCYNALCGDCQGRNDEADKETDKKIFFH